MNRFNNSSTLFFKLIINLKADMQKYPHPCEPCIQNLLSILIFFMRSSFLKMFISNIGLYFKILIDFNLLISDLYFVSRLKNSS